MTMQQPDETLQALADPTRRTILRMVWYEEQPAGAIAEQFTMSRPAVSKHLRVLREAGLLEERREGTKRLYRTVPSRIAELRAYLAEFWDARLEEVKRLAEKEAKCMREEHDRE